MPILDLCTGLGTLGEVVSELTGEPVKFFAEKDEAASQILAYHWPEIPNLGDITEIDWESLKDEVDIVAGGFPCQDISNAGPREGISGSRSGIWKNIVYGVGIIRPRFVFLENVAAIRTRGLNTVCEDLAQVGYDFRWTTVRASDFGLCHIRPRWFGIATLQDTDREPRIEWGATAPREEEGGGAWTNS